MEKTNDWKTLADVQSFRTSDPKEMRGKWLAAPVVNSWTEDFVDEDTKETVSLERNNVLMTRGTFLSDEEISQVMFFIQGYDSVKDVLVCSENISAERYISGRMIPYEVTLTNDLEAKTYLVRATSIEKAIVCIQNYAPLYRKLEGYYSVRSVKPVAYTIVEDDDESVLRNESEVVVTDYEYYKTTCRLDEYNEDKNKMEKTNVTLIIKASDVGEARARSLAWMKNTYKDNIDMCEQNRVLVVKAQPYATYSVVPLTYCEIFKEPETI